MAKIGEEQLKAQIKNGEFSNVYLLYGEETYLKQQYVALMKRKIIDPAFEDFNFHSFDGKNATLDEILMSADIMPMMSEYSLILVQDYPLLKAPTDLNKLKAFFEDIPESAILVFWFDNIEVEDNPKRTTPWSKVIQLFAKNGTAVNFERKTEAELAARLTNYAKKKKVILNNNRARLLISVVGFDMQTLMTELEKIIAYVGEGGEITKKEIELLATPSLEANIFKLSDYIIKGDSYAAYALINALITQKEEPSVILSRLADCYIDMYRVKCAKAADVRENQIAEDFSYPKNRAWRLRQAGIDAAPYHIKTLRKAIDVLARTDELMKSSPVDKKFLLEETISKLLVLRNR